MNVGGGRWGGAGDMWRAREERRQCRVQGRSGGRAAPRGGGCGCAVAGEEEVSIASRGGMGEVRYAGEDEVDIPRSGEVDVPCAGER